jgi:hypothetical protein
MPSPTFLIIGAMKAGTTALHAYLRQHPEIFLPEVKELNFFVDDYTGPQLNPPEQQNWTKGIDWYLSHFREAGRAKAIGEASPNYTRYPFYPHVPSRIACILPDVKLIYVLRHPIARIRSHYLHDLARGREKQPIAAAVLDDERYITASQYAAQIEEYLRFFDFNRLLILKSEELYERRRETVNRILHFLKVDEIDVPLHLDFEVHRTQEKFVPNRVLSIARNMPGRQLVPRPVRQVGLRLIAQRVESAVDIPEDVQNVLVKRLAPDLRRLRSMLGKQFDAWGLA